MKATNESEARKALEKIVKQAVGYKFFDGKLPDSNEEFESKIIDEAPNYVLLRDDWMEAIELARAALAVKPRNCDIGTTEEQNHRFNEFCKAHKELVLLEYRCSDDCPCLKTLSNIDCAIAWSQMPFSKGEKPHD